MLEILRGRNLSFLFSRSNLYNGLIQFFTIAINLLLLPLLLNVLGKERFGIWQTILSLIGYITLLNFGMGNGLRNTISKYYAEENFEAIGNLTGQTLKKLIKIILCFLFIVFPIYIYFFDPILIFRDLHNLSQETKYAIAIFLLFFLINIFSSMASSIAFGLNKSYLPGLFNVIYLMLIYIILSFVREANLILIAVVFGFVQLFINSVFFLLLLRKYQIKLSFNNKYQLKETVNLSSQFLIVQLLSIIFLTADNFIISGTLGVNYTAEYAIVSKIYFTLISVFSILLISFWNGVTIAFAKNNLIWIRKAIKQLLCVSVMVLLVGLIIGLFSEFILQLWFGSRTLNISKITFYLFSFYAFLHCLNAIFINYQNGIGDLRLQIMSTFSMILVLGCLSYFFNVEKYGYNLLIIIKILAVIAGMIINLKSLKHIR